MLVLRRRAGESFLIGDEIEIEILEVNSQGAKIGIRAPRATSILRKELKLIEEQNRVSAQSPLLPELTEKIKNLRTSGPARYIHHQAHQE